MDAIEKAIKTGWTIDVCMTCGRQATWPFCAHRRIDGPWCTSVHVKATPIAAKWLRRAVEIEHRPTFTCPRCGHVARNPVDVAQGYCVNCHAVTKETHAA